MKVVPPGSTIGILGGGQLERMTALAAAALGYKTHIYCQSDSEPAAQVSSRVTLGSFAEYAALSRFARAVDVVTFGWENLPLETIEAVADIVAVHPGAKVLSVAQDRVNEKTFARELGIATADFIAVNSAAELAAALQTIKPPAILKTRRMGYDGKGQTRIMPGDDPAAAWDKIGGAPAILEAMVDFAFEISVIAARRADGATAVYPPVLNIHKDGILAETHAPADIPPQVKQQAEAMALRLAEALKVVGLLAVEMFVLKKPDSAGNMALMNEIAPRPHNSGHWTMDACATSQFEQLVRAICGLPLGSTEACGHAVMHNLIGDDVKNCLQWLETPNAHLHLYGKSEIRTGRKMGHVTIVKT
ncbi:MAG: 5-(carboxyamino)imidazole ribonucleotide synthase [Alphaproteobacteria bacterium]